MRSLINAVITALKMMLTAAGSRYDVVINYVQPGMMEFYLVEGYAPGFGLLSPDFVYPVQPDAAREVASAVMTWAEGLKIKIDSLDEYHHVIRVDHYAPWRMAQGVAYEEPRMLEAWGELIGGAVLAKDEKGFIQGPVYHGLFTSALQATGRFCEAKAEEENIA